MYYDEASDFLWAKWYRNPIQWWRQRRLMKLIGKQIAEGRKNGTIWTSWQD